jgi:ketosteroid isomerase-like protein
VLTVVRFTATSRVTGQSMTQHLHHYFRFRDGTIDYYRGSEDTAATVATLRA